ncbi:hypothetical protein Tco_0408003 [Tanacetum coccineum]
MKQGWCGQEYKDLLWRATSATNVRDFEKCRAKSDLLLNNMCEVFNGKIVGGVIDKCNGPLTPTATRIMKSIKKEAHLMKVQWNGANKYQVSACWNMALNDRATPPPKTWVNPCYWLSTWKETYSHKIQPICGTKYWEKSICPTTLLPPKHHVQVGRPRKKRKRSKHEDEPFVKDGKLSRKGRTITCQSCENTGHNKVATTHKPVVVHLGKHNKQNLQLVKMVQVDQFSSAVSKTRNADGREMDDGVPTQSSAADGESEWYFL